jgi:hypothetical protein
MEKPKRLLANLSELAAEAKWEPGPWSIALSMPIAFFLASLAVGFCFLCSILLLSLTPSMIFPLLCVLTLLLIPLAFFAAFGLVQYEIMKILGQVYSTGILLMKLTQNEVSQEFSHCSSPVQAIE